MKIFNLNGDEWDRIEERPGWRSKDAWVGAHIDAELIGGSMYELEPGDRLWPYHTHHANEEWMIVLRGTPTLRTPEGEQELARGRRRLLPRGKDGLHQIRNGTDAPIRVLMLSTLIAPDIVEYLDSGKVGARSVAGERILLSRPGPDARLLGRRGLTLRADRNAASIANVTDARERPPGVDGARSPRSLSRATDPARVPPSGRSSGTRSRRSAPGRRRACAPRACPRT